MKIRDLNITHINCWVSIPVDGGVARGVLRGVEFSAIGEYTYGNLRIDGERMKWDLIHYDIDEEITVIGKDEPWPPR